MIDLNLLVFGDNSSDILDRDPLVFELQEQTRPKEIVETPEDAKVAETQKDAELASDKSALARNPETNRELDLGAAYAKGDFKFRELPSNQLPPGEAGAQSKRNNNANDNKPEETELTDYYTMNNSEKFTREYLINQRNPFKPGAQDDLPKIKYDNPTSRAPDMGGVSFNTYNWEFAPYMLALKKKVEHNIFPPPAFIRMGIISGETLLRFKIYPNGEMKGLEVLEYEGHETLMQTSVRAIEISAPFAPLPSNFPEAYLEVTAKFHYFIPKHQ